MCYKIIFEKITEKNLGSRHFIPAERDFEISFNHICGKINNIAGVLEMKPLDAVSVVVVTNGMTKDALKNELEPFLKDDIFDCLQLFDIIEI